MERSDALGCSAALLGQVDDQAGHRLFHDGGPRDPGRHSKERQSLGRQKGVAQVYRSHKEQGSLLKKVKLEIAVNEAFVEKTIQAITGGAQSGQIRAGKIFVLDLPECVRIRTGERGGEAIG